MRLLLLVSLALSGLLPAASLRQDTARVRPDSARATLRDSALARLRLLSLRVVHACPMPVARPDTSQTRRMPTVRPTPGAAIPMPTQRPTCVNPLFRR